MTDTNCNCGTATLVVETTPAPEIQVETPATPILPVDTKDRGPAGKDAKINGVNTLTLTAEHGIELIQDGETATLSGEALELADAAMQQQIDGKVDSVSGTGVISVTRTGNDIEIKSATYIHEQAIASAVWEVTHNLGKYPSVMVVDSSGNEVLCAIEYNTENTLTLRMNYAFKGKAYLN